MLTLETAIQKIQRFSPEQQNKVIEFIEFLEFQSNQAVANRTEISFTEATQEFIGCFDSDIEDLSYNSKYLEGLGK